MGRVILVVAFREPFGWCENGSVHLNEEQPVAGGRKAVSLVEPPVR